MSMINISVDGDNGECILTVNNIAVKPDSVDLYKYIDGEGKSQLYFSYEIKVQNENGLEERRRYTISRPKNDDEESGYAKVSVLKDKDGLEYTIVSDNDRAAKNLVDMFLNR